MAQTAGATSPTAGDAAAPDRVVVGFDGSPGSHLALRWAAREAERRGAPLQVVSSWEKAGDPDPSSPDEPAEVAAERVQQALRALLLEGVRLERISYSTPQGPAGPVLLEAATGADLLVLGTTGLEAKQSPGPVSAFCLRHARIPVAFVPSSWPGPADTAHGPA
ncbi:universal stress protein [Actinomadura scrupuli]|uniref:universal stress protein n=1 Tax=Actinomadura scrupuli TaxID=559629 RepID=UPI003D98D120